MKILILCGIGIFILSSIIMLSLMFSGNSFSVALHPGFPFYPYPSVMIPNQTFDYSVMGVFLGLLIISMGIVGDKEW